MPIKLTGDGSEWKKDDESLGHFTEKHIIMKTTLRETDERQTDGLSDRQSSKQWRTDDTGELKFGLSTDLSQKVKWFRWDPNFGLSTYLERS